MSSCGGLSSLMVQQQTSAKVMLHGRDNCYRWKSVDKKTTCSLNEKGKVR